MAKYRNYGSISGWDKITADTPLNIRGDIEKAKEIEDILEIIRSISTEYGIVTTIKDALDTHISDPDNPHQINITINDINIYEVLYAEYVARYGNDIPLSDFIDLFNFLRQWATTEDVDLGINLDRTVNLFIAQYIIDKHNSSPSSHSDILDIWFTGESVRVPPTLAIEPVVEPVEYLTAIRNSPMNVYDRDGRVREVPVDTVGISHINGVPVLPVFRSRSNYILNSRKPALALSGSIDQASTAQDIFTPLDDQIMHRLVGATGSGTVSATVDLATINPMIQLSSRYYVYSFGYYPQYAKSLDIEIQNNDGTFDIVRVNLQTKDTSWDRGSGTAPVYPNGGVVINDLNNGWYIISLSMDVGALGGSTTLSRFVIYPCHPATTLPYGDRITSPTAGQEICCLWQHQFESGVIPSPPIFSNDIVKTVGSTQIFTEFDLLMSRTGAFSIQTISPSFMTVEPAQVVSPLATVMDQTDTSRAIYMFNTGATSTIETYNSSGNMVTTINSSQYPIDHYVRQTVFSYTEGLQTYGFTDQDPAIHNYLNLSIPVDADEDPLAVWFDAPADARIRDDVGKLYIGFDPVSGTYLDSYILSLYYYPCFMSRDNISFLLQ